MYFILLNTYNAWTIIADYELIVEVSIGSRYEYPHNAL